MLWFRSEFLFRGFPSEKQQQQQQRGTVLDEAGVCNTGVRKRSCVELHVVGPQRKLTATYCRVYDFFVSSWFWSLITFGAGWCWQQEPQGTYSM